MEPQSFGYWLRRKRKSLDLTREGLAAQVGCSAATIRKIEDEERRPSAQIAARLADIFAIPPGEQPAFIQFARGGMLSAPVAPDGLLPWQPTAAPRTNLPASVTSLIGREGEIEALCAYLRNAHIRLVTLVGPPGIGKTRLGIEAARAMQGDFADGAYFVSLGPVANPALTASTIAQTLGLVEAGGRDTAQALRDGIADKHLLLVLDNCEHLIDETALLAASLLGHCANLSILATSRESLRIPGEWLFPVPPLAFPEEGDAPLEAAHASQFSALRLFAERARAVHPDFSLTPANLPAVAAICARLDGLPLAIELLAARMRVVSPQDLLARMNNDYVMSADGVRAVANRQKTLGNAIHWSYDTLTPEEQRALLGVSVFSGGFTLDAAEAVLQSPGAGAPTLDLLTALVNKSLLHQSVSAAGGARFTMLVTIQQFASVRLKQSLELEDTYRNRHLDYYTQFAEQAARELRGPNQVEWGQKSEDELNNFRAALAWSASRQFTARALRLLGALGWPWEVRGHYSEARDWLEKISALPDSEHYPLHLARALNHIGRHNWTQERALEAGTLLEKSCQICEELGKAGEPALADALNWLGLVRLFNDRDPDTARAMFTRSLEISTRWHSKHEAAISTFHLGLCESQQNNTAAALSLLEESRAQFQQCGDLFFMARSALFIGYVYMGMGEYDQARHYMEEHLRLDTQIQFWDGIAEGWRDLGNLYWRQGLAAEANRCYEQCVLVSQAHGLKKSEVFYLFGVLALNLGRPDLAEQRFSTLLEQKLHEKDRALCGVTLMGMAALASTSEAPERAARLCGAAQTLIENGRENFANPEKVEFERHIQRAREQLGYAGFEQLAAQGRAMPVEAAIAYALSADRR